MRCGWRTSTCDVVGTHNPWQISHWLPKLPCGRSGPRRFMWQSASEWALQRGDLGTHVSKADVGCCRMRPPGHALAWCRFKLVANREPLAAADARRSNRRDRAVARSNQHGLAPVKSLVLNQHLSVVGDRIHVDGARIAELRDTSFGALPGGHRESSLAPGGTTRNRTNQALNIHCGDSTSSSTGRMMRVHAWRTFVPARLDEERCDVAGRGRHSTIWSRG